MKSLLVWWGGAAGSGAKLAVLANASEQRGADGAPMSIRLTVFRAKNRRDY